MLIAVFCAGCGGGSGGGTTVSTPAGGFQLAGIDSDYVDGASRNSTTILFYNPVGETFEQWTADSSSNYYYDETGALIQEDIEYLDSALMDSVIYFYDDNGNLTSKRYERIDTDGQGQLYLTVNFTYDDDGHILSETHVTPYTVDGNGAVLVQDTLMATISYIYAYQDGTQSELILIEKRAISADGETRVYFRYDAAKENVVSIEYDWNNDFSIDAIMYVTYDSQGNRQADEIYDYDIFGDEFLKLTLLYTWESITPSPNPSSFADSGLALGLCGGPYY